MADLCIPPVNQSSVKGGEVKHGSWNPRRLSNKYLEADTSGRASPVGMLLSKAQVSNHSSEPPRLTHLRTAVQGSSSESASPAALVKKTTLLLDKSAKKLAHLQLSESRSGRASPIVSQLGLASSECDMKPHPTVGFVKPQVSESLVKPKVVAASTLKPGIITLTYNEAKVYNAFSRAVASMDDRKSPVNFFGKYLDANNASGCHTPTAAYPGLDNATFEAVRRRQEDMRRKFHTMNLISV